MIYPETRGGVRKPLRICAVSLFSVSLFFHWPNAVMPGHTTDRCCTGLRCFLELKSCSSKDIGVIWRRFLHSLTLRRKKEKSARPGIPVVLSSWKIYPVACEACTYLSAQSPVWSWSWLGPRWAESCWPRDTRCQWGRDSWGTWGHMGLHPQSLAGSAAGPGKEHGTSSYISLLLMWWKT